LDILFIRYHFFHYLLQKD